MGENNSEDVISQDFLEKALGRKINSFKITSGSKIGDNYSSIMYSIEVEFPTKSEDGTEGKEIAYLISKCYPGNPVRQDLLNQTNMFWKELAFYRDYVPKLIQMQRELNMKEIIRPDFPPYVAGHAPNFYTDPIIAGKLYAPFDNYIIMVDVRKTFGFELVDTRTSLDKIHVALVMEAMATAHALSWIYKKKHNLAKLTDQFPFMDTEYCLQSMATVLQDFLKSNGEHSCDTLEQVLGKDSSIVRGTKQILENVSEICKIRFGIDGRDVKEYEKFLRVKPKSVVNEIPWKVGILGDVWQNNMMFRYNKETGIPEAVIHFDMQLCSEDCPTLDLVYVIYASTDSEFRKHHLDNALNLYVNKFKEICGKFNTEPLPNFTETEFKRRFHRSKVYGYCTGLMVLPFSQIEKSQLKDVESTEGDNLAEMMASMLDNNNATVNKRYVDKVVGLARDIYEDGVI